jgi:hypothetical protein
VAMASSQTSTIFTISTERYTRTPYKEHERPEVWATVMSKLLHPQSSFMVPFVGSDSIHFTDATPALPTDSNKFTH